MSCQNAQHKRKRKTEQKDTNTQHFRYTETTIPTHWISFLPVLKEEIRKGEKIMYPGLSDTTSRNPTPRSSRGVCVYLLHNSHHMSAIYDLQDHARRNTIQRKDEKRTRKRNFCQIKACHGSPSSAAVVGRKGAQTTWTSVGKTGVIK